MKKIIKIPDFSFSLSIISMGWCSGIDLKVKSLSTECTVALTQQKCISSNVKGTNS